MTADAERAPQRVGRYAVFDAIAAGGMATVHLARLAGQEGFSRVVAVKRLHPHLLLDPEFKRMFLVEARLAARVRHPNVVPILDVIAHKDELIIVMEYVHGESLIGLLRAAKGRKIPLAITCSIMVSVLQGLHAAHEACDESGRPLHIVHRDVSPHNIMIGADGVARVLDFGIAKAIQARQDTNPGVLKGKCSYMAPETLQGEPVTCQADVFAAATVFWELLTGKKLFHGATEEERIQVVLAGEYPAPRQIEPSVPIAVERIVMKGLRADPRVRYESALEMAVELEQAFVLASQRVVGQWVSDLAADTLAQRAELLREVESSGITARPSFIDQLSRPSSAPPGPSDRPEAGSTGNENTLIVPRRRRWIPWAAAGAAVIAVGAMLTAIFAKKSTPPPATTTSAIVPVVVRPPTAHGNKSGEPEVTVVENQEPQLAENPASSGASAPAPSPAPTSRAAQPNHPKRAHAKSYLPDNL